MPFSSIVIMREPNALQISMAWPLDDFAHKGVVWASRDKVIANNAIQVDVLNRCFLPGIFNRFYSLLVGAVLECSWWFVNDLYASTVEFQNSKATFGYSIRAEAEDAVNTSKAVGVCNCAVAVIQCAAILQAHAGEDDGERGGVIGQ